jgi:hypothetical protein
MNMKINSSIDNSMVEIGECDKNASRYDYNEYIKIEVGW